MFIFSEPKFDLDCGFFISIVLHGCRVSRSGFVLFLAKVLLRVTLSYGF